MGKPFSVQSVTAGVEVELELELELDPELELELELELAGVSAELGEVITQPTACALIG